MSKATAVAAPAKETKEKVGPSASKVQQAMIDSLTTVSARIRYLDDQGFSRSEITKLITNATGGVLRYQHVRGVLESNAPKQKAS